MLRLHSLLVSVLVLVCSSPCWAEGTAQLTLTGDAGPRGALVELNVTALAQSDGAANSTQSDVSFFVAPFTTGRDLLSLLSARLRSEGIGTVFTPAGTGPTSLFIVDASRVRTRVGGSFEVTVSTSQNAPLWVRLDRPAQLTSPSKLNVVVSARASSDGRTQSGVLSLDLAGNASSPSVSSALVDKAGALGWLTDRPQLNSWRPLKLGDGLQVIGCSVKVSSKDPWWVDIGL